MKLIKDQLLHWYNENQRDLPWRRTKDPYAILVSEVMLQQTTVSVVKSYYEKFISEFPTVEDLAKASESKVLSLWSGLGYYSRARNLHRAAKEMINLGTFPKSYDELLKLSGIGPYTAAAVVSIAFGEEVPCIDGNVIRVISRIFDVSEKISAKEGREMISKKARALIAGQDPSLHNQAMMELGATLCRPKNPACLICPVMKSCQALKAGTVSQRPVKDKKRKRESWLWQMTLVKKNGRIAFVKSSNGTPWLKNTWMLPGKARPWNKTKPPPHQCRHSITHHKIFVQLLEGKKLPPGHGEIRWIAPQKISALHVSSVVQKVLKGSYT